MNGAFAIMPATPAAASSLDIDALPLPYAEVDAGGIIIRANRAALALHHPEQGDLIGKSGWDLMACREKDFSSAAFLSQMASGADPPVIIRSLFDRSGSFRTYQMHRSFIRDAGGNPAGMRIIFVDVTDALKQLDETRLALQWFEKAIASLADAVVLTDPLGFVRTVNHAAEEMFGWAAQDLTGKVIEDVIPILAYEPIDGPPLDRRVAIEKQCKGIATLLTRQHLEVRFEMSTSPILDENSGSVIGVAAVLRRLDAKA
jgi:PAS domain S-box-containing protein